MLRKNKKKNKKTVVPASASASASASGAARRPLYQIRRRECSLSRAINNDFVSSHNTQGSSKKTFKVLWKFRVLVDWKKKGGGILNLCFLLCLTKSTRFGYGAGLFVWQNRFKNTTRAFITQERLRSSHAKEVRNTRGTRKERKRFLFFITEKGIIAECGRAER